MPHIDTDVFLPEMNRPWIESVLFGNSDFGNSFEWVLTLIPILSGILYGLIIEILQQLSLEIISSFVILEVILTPLLENVRSIFFGDFSVQGFLLSGSSWNENELGYVISETNR